MTSRYARRVDAGDRHADARPSHLGDSEAAEERTRLDPSRTCPNCGAALTDRSCKLLCPTPGCGYYLSCSDFY
jgi:hypothetical protein